jgi:UDP-N-acetylmuramoyl-tripeptide--D-alanyl-D-alanine ligase
MAAAIANHLATTHADYGRKVLILGDMLELGEWSREEHCRVLGEALRGDADLVVVVGRNFCRAVEESGLEVERFGSAEEACEWLQREPLEGAFVLVKGSRGVGLERLIPLL